jgi:hypothetical protein
MMDQRRARMRRRPSDQARGAGFTHASSPQQHHQKAGLAQNLLRHARAKARSASSR